MTRPPSDDEPFSALAFKIMTDPFVGSLTFVRIYSGTLRTGTAVLNSVKDKRERIGRMLLMHANHREDIKEAFAGDIVALAGLKDTTTGDTLCDPDNAGRARAHGIPRSGHRDRGRAQDQGRSGEDGPGAAAPRAGRPVVPRRRRSRNRPDHHQGHGRAASRDHRRPHEARVQGRGQCRRAAGGLSRDHHASKADRSITRTRSRSGGSGQFARVIIDFEPLPPGSGFVFENEVVGGSVPKEYIPGVEKGLRRSIDTGVLAGFPTIDFKATLIDGAYHDVDSSAPGVRNRRRARPSAKACRRPVRCCSSRS